MGDSLVFMFSGQGSQYYHMGKDLFDHHPAFRKCMLGLNDIAYQLIGESVIDKVYDATKRRDEQFDRTLYSHPAIFMVEFSLAQVMIEKGVEPDYVLGASLGEFVSAAIAGVMAVEELLESLFRQAEIFESTCKKGGMLAVIHDVALYNESPIMHENSELASVNYDSHFVISGTVEKLKDIEKFLNTKGILFQALPVSFAFHSSLIDPAASPYKRHLNNKSYKVPSLPVVSCFYGNTVNKIPENYLWDVVRKPVEFLKTVRTLESGGKHLYLDLGPSGGLDNFVRHILNSDSESRCGSFRLSPFGRELGSLERAGEFFLKRNLRTGKGRVKRMKAYVFPGQGAQYKGMGGTLFDEFEELTAKADSVLGYSIKQRCLEDPQRQLHQTQYTQPALYTVNALSYLKKMKEDGTPPDYVAGHSLGEYNALFAAGAFDFEDGLKIVKKRGELMSQAAGGGMAAVLGLNEGKIEEILRENNLAGIGFANYNSPSQIVISGPSADINGAAAIFEKAGARYIPLNVSGAFHSRYMQPSKELFEEFLTSFTFRNLSLPVISNVHARPYKQDEVKKNLVEQITHPVQWTESVRFLMGRGEMEIEEIGPGDILKKLVATIRKEAVPLVLTDEGEDKLQETKKAEENEFGNSAVSMRDPSKAKVLDEERQSAEGKRVAKAFPDITAASLGDAQFKEEYKLKYAYVAGSMYRGIASKELLVRMGRAGMLGFFGTGGLELGQIEEAITWVQSELKDGQTYGMNLLFNPVDFQKEEETVTLFLKHGVRNIEASAYMGITLPLVRYRLTGVKRNPDGTVSSANRIIAKVSRPEVAEAFLSPAPERLVEKLAAENRITREEALLAKELPVAEDLCVEADSGGHTDGGVAYALMPAMIKLRDEMVEQHRYSKNSG